MIFADHVGIKASDLQVQNCTRPSRNVGNNIKKLSWIEASIYARSILNYWCYLKTLIQMQRLCRMSKYYRDVPV
jgi:hypothetical protein